MNELTLIVPFHRNIILSDILLSIMCSELTTVSELRLHALFSLPSPVHASGLPEEMLVLKNVAQFRSFFQSMVNTVFLDTRGRAEGSLLNYILQIQRLLRVLC